MKFGQALSVFEAALPDELAGPYRDTLTRLQDSAPPMDRAAGARGAGARARRRVAPHVPSLRRRPGRGRLDRPGAPGGLARRPRGRGQGAVPRRGRGPAAPTCGRSPARPGCSASWLPDIDVKPLVAELQARVGEELDYRLEADAQQRFHEAFADDPDVVVPAVVEGTERVLVTTWMDSVGSLARLIAEGDPGGPQPLRHALRAVPVLRAGPGRAAARRPAPGQLPDARRRPARRRRLRRGRAAPRRESAARRSGGCCAAPSTTTGRRCSTGLRDEGFVKPGVDLDVEVLRDYLTPFVEPAEVADVRRSTGPGCASRPTGSPTPAGRRSPPPPGSTCRRATC